MVPDVLKKTITELREGLDAGDYSVSELNNTYLKYAEKENKNVNAFLEFYDDIEDQSKKVDSLIKKDGSALLCGLPVALKDNILIEDKCVSAGSKILQGYSATYDATVTEKLKNENVIFLGRTNMDEFAMGSSTEHSAFGPTKNPHDLSRVPGGSSGGSAAAVAADFVPLAFGSDTGGSIRQPASFCGCVGLKPTYGTVSRHGLIALGSSLDQIGPLTKTVGDAEVAFNVIKGVDPLDSTSRVYDGEASKDTPKSFNIGVPWGFFKEGVDKDVLERFETSLKKLEKEGHTVTEVTLPHVKYSLAAYYIIMPAEASTNLARFDGMRYGLHKEGSDLLDTYKQSRGSGFGSEVQRRILLGTYVLSAGYYDAFYGKANDVKAIITQDFAHAFEKVDVIATPTTPTPAFKLNEKSDPLSMYLADIFTVPANITGMPGISIPMEPVKRDNKDLPIGIQLLAPHGKEILLFALGKYIEILRQ